MANDKAQGSAKETTGKVEETVGKVAGDQEMEDRGKAEQAEGSIQKGIGKIKEIFTGKS